jgi:hypothetical protein
MEARDNLKDLDEDGSRVSKEQEQMAWIFLAQNTTNDRLCTTK